MTMASSATPLIALDAVVVDTETTSLDAAKARIAEIAAVRIAHGQVDLKAPFRTLVRPDGPIPPSATRIHGIDDAAVARARPFRHIWPALKDFIGEAVVIGHSVGFDLAVLKSECERAGLPFVRPRALDTRLLAEIARPDLAGYGLEQVASWLDIEVGERHSALGDAATTAKVFVALVPKLREAGIRTLAEAEQACCALTAALEQHHRAGWIGPQAPSRFDAERSLRRIDSYPYRHTAADLMSAPAKCVPAETSVSDALTMMARERISSVFVAAVNSTPPRAQEAGIVTERDVLRALAEHGSSALQLPVRELMSRPLATVPADAFVYRAIARMSRLKIRHLGVTDEDGALVGALSARDLLRLRAQEAVQLGDEIDVASNARDLARAWAKLPAVAAGLRAEQVSARDIAVVISRELGALTGRAAAIAEVRMGREGHGPPPCRYAVAILGSAGRGESLLALDQDNALVFADGEPGGAEDRWFAGLGGHMADILHEAGVPYCKGGVMAKNPQWRGSLATWKKRVSDWIGRSKPGDLLSVDIFFDLRPVHGDATLANRIWHDAFKLASAEMGFAKLLAEAAGSPAPGLSLFGGFRTKDGRLNLKTTGLFGIVNLARVLAIRHGVVERSTAARLAGIKALGLRAESELDALLAAHGVFLDFILAQQIADIERGLPPTNTVAVKQLTRADRDRLRTALESVKGVEQLIRLLLFR
jgi:DNA polymerase-3 subunit epsilon/CBS domain-containing protein